METGSEPVSSATGTTIPTTPFARIPSNNTAFPDPTDGPPRTSLHSRHASPTTRRPLHFRPAACTTTAPQGAVFASVQNSTTKAAECAQGLFPAETGARWRSLTMDQRLPAQIQALAPYHSSRRPTASPATVVRAAGLRHTSPLSHQRHRHGGHDASVSHRFFSVAEIGFGGEHTSQLGRVKRHRGRIISVG